MDFKKLHWPGMTHFKRKCFFFCPNATQLVARGDVVYLLRLDSLILAGSPPQRKAPIIANFCGPVTPGGGGKPHMKGVGMLVGNFELNP